MIEIRDSTEILRWRVWLTGDGARDVEIAAFLTHADALAYKLAYEAENVA